MKIVFVLPSTTWVPVGGFKVVYEYANRLARRGHRVKVVHAQNAAEGGLAARLRGRLAASRMRRRPAGAAPWFDFDPAVEVKVVPALEPGVFDPSEVLVATAWDTAAVVAETVGEAGFYLIQHYETWGGEESVRETWRLPLRKIVISGWLWQIAEEMGEGGRTSVIPNGLDFERLGVDVPIERREARVGGLLGPLKGEADVIGAMTAARERLPGLEAVTFGTRPRPDRLPAWIEHRRLPDARALRALYNSCSIFLQASASEGWGLPATEAMACGCALVTYDNGGSREYARDGDTALVVERGEANLAAAIVSLTEDTRRREAVARRGREAVSAFTWERAVGSLEATLGVAGGVGRG